MAYESNSNHGEDNPSKNNLLSNKPPNPPNFDPSSKFAQDLHDLVARFRKTSPEDLSQLLNLTVPLAFHQVRAITNQISYSLSHHIETRLGTCTVGTSMFHTGVIWTLCCRSKWVAKVSSEWMAFSNVPMRALVFVGMTAHYLNPPVQKRDATWYIHEAKRFWKSLG
ncbi:uncharacterized protein UMAG_00306 [Mycosarcoma maydis]|uniref:Uncharacterized protein n=1 Tax=Mycosarcoma maydis TaxID=5270 RepID=A0A0D1D039_MYCMD|nr:uncharacterized protein UMAG_00306 [Ustilago maydis 521]KIS71878.1 hypothetical protein UMAG_00306 [Ustilago maydis 521]|eukprot:XP_011386216.1 hypothetical protein UMAG_00306 [Ustilago maydis 521]